MFLSHARGQRRHRSWLFSNQRRVQELFVLRVHGWDSNWEGARKGSKQPCDATW
jgi:hypothetical protein